MQVLTRSTCVGIGPDSAANGYVMGNLICTSRALACGLDCEMAISEQLQDGSPCPKYLSGVGGWGGVGIFNPSGRGQVHQNKVSTIQINQHEIQGKLEDLSALLHV